MIELEEEELGEQLSRGGPDPSLTEEGLPHAASLDNRRQRRRADVEPCQFRSMEHTAASNVPD
jgi:hypothetical protein